MIEFSPVSLGKPMRLCRIILAMCLLCCPAAAENRIALLIGNQGYTAEIGRLSNPHNDVAILEKALVSIGFEVSIVRDASLTALHQAINAHVRRVRTAGEDTIGFIYYSGHGAQDAGTGVNYVIPVDVASAEDTELWDRSLRLNEVTRKLKAEAGNASHFVVIDACRNALKLRRTGSRAVIQPKGFVPQREETGMLIAYATAEGELASDTGVGSGPYARVLAEEIVKPGLEAVAMFRRVQLRVRSAIGQEPWLGFGALGEVHLAGPAPPAMQSPPTPSYEQQAELSHWSAVSNSNDRGVVQTYLDRYPHGAFADLARALIAKLQREEEQRTAVVRTEPGEIVRALQHELKRVGCFGGTVDGQFDPGTRAAFAEFAKLAVVSAASAEPDLEMVRLVRRFDKRVCPLKCAAGEKIEGDLCVRIACAAGQMMKNGACVEAPIAKESANPSPKPQGKNCFAFEGRKFCQ
jgi:uncharacterized caspase-like protein